jgi:hypothetical protein
LPEPRTPQPFRATSPLSPGCLPSVRCSAFRPSEAPRVPCNVRAERLAPLSPGACGLSHHKMSRRTALFPPTRIASRLSSKARRRCFSPTSATDSRHEHPQLARFPDTQLAPRWPPDPSSTEIEFFSGGAGPPRGDPAPARSALDGTPPASTCSNTFPALPLFGRALGTSTACLRCRLAAAFSTTHKAAERPLTLPVAPRGSR